MKKIIPKLDWKVFVNAAVQVRSTYDCTNVVTQEFNLYQSTTILTGFTKCLFFLFQIGHGNDLSDELIDDYEDDEEYLKKVHHLLMEVSLG